jgi:hypothetical protein
VGQAEDAMDRTRGSIDYARTTAASKTESVRQAVVNMQAAVVLAITGIKLNPSFAISAADVGAALGAVATYDAPTTANKPHGAEPP